ncbi:MAG TPA: bifunctional DNA-formamidopyrimidine glycosylase/DNA-(apurinic or apyrimidinic site) lyase [Candidatus Acidoferrales bacterium]|jgi:formamidopyrimidine-DNA glycosylase|nr:bifunctional DNA-formamidopyrimidine glycosylase/DNA-(apurinic or apyrimidinic site) lyase [Candidatus Acidoferrales bacterium]
MPELPEVETVVRGLRAVLPGRRILTVRLGKTDFIEDPAALERDLPGSRIASVRRHGKFVVVDLEASRDGAPNFSLLVHLGMTGQIVVGPLEAPIVPHTHVFFALDDGREFRYTDIRRFGKMRILSSGTQETALGKLGLDPLEATQSEFFAQLRGRRARIKALLLDQHVLRGMGNIYTDESLWRARIHPMRLGANLKNAELHRLHRAVREVLEEAIRMRGSSVSDYVDSEGRRGTFQQRHRVYQRKGKKCFRGDGLICRAIVAGRSSYYCPGCQPAPRTRRRTTR